MTPGDPTLIDRAKHWLTFHVRLVYRARCWWHDRKGRPGWAPREYPR